MEVEKKEDKKDDKKGGKKAFPRLSFSFIKILTGSDLSNRRLPIMVAKGEKPGPTIWLTGCAHGDEVDAIVVIQEIFKIIKKTPLLKGTLYAFPLMNPIGFETISRQVTLSEEDLNRSFPGNEKGSLAERIADKIFATIINTKPALVLDLHSSWRGSVPYAFVDKDEKITNRDAYEKTKVFAKRSGFLTVYEDVVVEQSLTFNLINKGIPALTIELGESYVVNEKNVEHGVKSVLNILSYLEMTEPQEEFVYPTLPAALEGKTICYSDKPFSSTSGIIRFLIKTGDIVKKGQPLAKIYNTFGRLLETMIASDDCVILGYSDFSVAFPGGLVIVVGTIK